MIDTEMVVGTGLRITVSKDELVSALGVVSRAVSTRTSVQILSGILVEAQGSELRLAATDMELSLRATASAQIEGDGAIVLPGKTFADIARLLPAGDVSIEHKPAESVVHVTAGSASYTLHTYNPEDFPRLQELESLQTFTVDRESLLDTIHRVARAASRDESRPVLTGILVSFTGGKLVMAATDSYRLAVKETELNGTVPGARSDRAEPRAAGARAHCRQRRQRRGRRAREPGRLCNRRRVADDAPHRRTVPELPAAAARAVRARAHAAAPGAARSRSARVGDDPARDAACNFASRKASSP